MGYVNTFAFPLAIGVFWLEQGIFTFERLLSRLGQGFLDLIFKFRLGFIFVAFGLCSLVTYSLRLDQGKFLDIEQPLVRHF